MDHPGQQRDYVICIPVRTKRPDGRHQEVTLVASVAWSPADPTPDTGELAAYQRTPARQRLIGSPKGT